jgi:hypothetical protein
MDDGLGREGLRIFIQGIRIPRDKPLPPCCRRLHTMARLGVSVEWSDTGRGALRPGRVGGRSREACGGGALRSGRVGGRSREACGGGVSPAPASMGDVSLC